MLALCAQYLQDLDLSAITDSIILAQLKKVSFPNLIKLKLRIFTWSSKHCVNSFKKMIKLETLHITAERSRGIPRYFFKAISTLANTLKELTIVNYTNYQSTTNNKRCFYRNFFSKDEYEDDCLAVCILIIIFWIRIEYLIDE